jgi:two-component system nitrate/nitrite response regulator NarL
MLKIIICDDHKVLVDALSMALSGGGRKVVATALDPDEAVRVARVHQPDVCLLDVHFPNGNGLRAIGLIHAVSPRTKVVILSGSISPGLVAEAIAQGAQGFVGKEKPIGVIIEALEWAHQGHLAVDPVVLQDVLLPRANIDDPLWVLKFLTEREWDALRCIKDGLSTERMAEQLGVKQSTARTHVKSLLSKLGVHSRLQAAALMTANASEEMWPAHLRDAPPGVTSTPGRQSK